MGIMTRKLDQGFVITSDCGPLEAPTKRVAKRTTSVYHAWTGNAWSAVRPRPGQRRRVYQRELRSRDGPALTPSTRDP